MNQSFRVSQRFACMVTIGLAGASASQAQSDAVCIKALEVGTSTFSSNANLNSVNKLYHTFCRTKIESSQEAKQRSQDAGFKYSDVLKASYKSNNLESQTKSYFETYCSDLSNFSSLQESLQTELQTANTKAAETLLACRGRGGFVGWVEYTDDPRRFTIHHDYSRWPGIAEMPELRYEERDPGRTIQLRPADAFVDPYCSNEPAIKAELSLDAPREISCAVKPDWNGTSVTVSAELVSRSWWGRIKRIQPVLMHIDVPPLQPKAPPKPMPKLMLQQLISTNPFKPQIPPPQFAPLGKWVSIDLGQVVRPGNFWKAWASPDFTLRIVDEGRTLSGENIFGRMQKTTWYDKDGLGKPRADESEPMQIIVVDPDLTFPVTAHFASMSNPAKESFYNANNETKRSAIALELDATKAQTIGMQAQFTDGCLSDVMTTAPGGKPLSWPVARGVDQCVLRLRLCAMPNSSLHDSSNSCEASVVDGFMNTARLMEAEVPR